MCILHFRQLRLKNCGSCPWSYRQKTEELGVKARGGRDIAILSWAHRDFSKSQFGSSDVTELWPIHNMLPGPALNNIQLHPPVLPSPSTESWRDVSSMAGL